MSHPKAPYPARFLQQMIDLVTTGRMPSELASEFGRHETSILSWMRAAKGVEGAPSALLNAAERQELVELRRKLRQVQRERNISPKRFLEEKNSTFPTWIFNSLLFI